MMIRIIVLGLTGLAIPGKRRSDSPLRHICNSCPRASLPKDY